MPPLVLTEPPPPPAAAGGAPADVGRIGTRRQLDRAVESIAARAIAAGETAPRAQRRAWREQLRSGRATVAEVLEAIDGRAAEKAQERADAQAFEAARNARVAPERAEQTWALIAASVPGGPRSLGGTLWPKVYPAWDLRGQTLTVMAWSADGAAGFLAETDAIEAAVAACGLTVRVDVVTREELIAQQTTDRAPPAPAASYAGGRCRAG